MNSATTVCKRFEVRFGGVVHEIESTSHREAVLSVVRAELGPDMQVESAGRWYSMNGERWGTATLRPRLVLSREIES